MSDTHLTDVHFDSLDLDPRVRAGLSDLGFVLCTPIQAEALPLVLAGRDVAGQAQTGTGKTAAYVVATLQRLLTHEPGTERRATQPRALILAPTRELAVQIEKDTSAIAGHTGFRVALAFGGTGYQQQREQIASGVEILIGTPGRLIDYFKQGVFDLRAIEVVVVDEADRMFDLGFIRDLRYLLRRMPKPEARLGMLFSATLSYRVTELAYEHMNDPQMIRIEPDQVTAERVQQVCYMTANEEKIPLLIGLLRAMEDARVMVFVNTKRTADQVWGFLEGNGLHAAVLSGDVPQKQRLGLLKSFQEGHLPVLVATDVAARGLHIPGVTHVINFDLPDDAEDYVHRIGRTARAGAAGDAISFVCETHAFSLPDVEAFIGIKIPILPVEHERLAAVDPASRVRTARPRLGPPRGRPGERSRPPRDASAGKSPTRRRRPGGPGAGPSGG